MREREAAAYVCEAADVAEQRLRKARGKACSGDWDGCAAMLRIAYGVIEDTLYESERVEAA